MLSTQKIACRIENRTFHAQDASGDEEAVLLDS